MQGILSYLYDFPCRSLYDELGGQYNLPRMSDPGAAYNPDSDGYHGDPTTGYHDNPAGDYRGDDLTAGFHGDPVGGYRDNTAGDYHGAPVGGYHGDHGVGFHSDGEYDARRDAEERNGFLTLRPEETDAGLTEMINTPRQHLDTSGQSARGLVMQLRPELVQEAPHVQFLLPAICFFFKISV